MASGQHGLGRDERRFSRPHNRRCVWVRCPRLQHRGRAQGHAQGRRRSRFGAQLRRGTTEPGSVQTAWLRTAALLHRGLTGDRAGRLGIPGVRHRRLWHCPGSRGRRRLVCLPNDDGPVPELAEPVQPDHRLCPSPAFERKLSHRTRGSDPIGVLRQREPGPGGLRGRQRRPVHLERSPGSLQSLRAHGRRLGRHCEAECVLQPAHRRTIPSLRLGRQRTQSVDAVGV